MLFVQGPAGRTAHQLYDRCRQLLYHREERALPGVQPVRGGADEVAAKLERIVKAVRKAVSEVAIVNYQDSVA